MKSICLVLPLLLSSCADQDGDDWYDQTVEHNRQRDEYIEDMVDAGLTAEEARDLHDRSVWEMNTINMSRQSGIPEEFRDNQGR